MKKPPSGYQQKSFSMGGSAAGIVYIIGDTDRLFKGKSSFDDAFFVFLSLRTPPLLDTLCCK